MPRIAMLFLPGTLLLTAACAEERLVEVIDLPPEFSGSQALITDEDTPTEPLTITLLDTETEEGGIALQRRHRAFREQAHVQFIVLDNENRFASA